MAFGIYQILKRTALNLYRRLDTEDYEWCTIYEGRLQSILHMQIHFHMFIITIII